MARLKVTRATRGPGRVIAGVWGPSFDYRTAAEVIEHIEGGTNQYYVRAASHETGVRVVERDGVKQLVSTRDILSRNNLQNLPTC